MLVEFGKYFLIGGIFLKNWRQQIILGSRKSAILGITWTPGFMRLFFFGTMGLLLIVPFVLMKERPIPKNNYQP